MRSNDLLPQADLLLEMLDAQETFDSSLNFLTLPTDTNSTTTSKNYNQQEENKTTNLDATNSKRSFFLPINSFD